MLRDRLAAALLLTALLAAPAAFAREHVGILGLKWGSSPADAKPMLVGKLTLVSEKPAEEAPYDTIDQHFDGTFAKLPTTDVFLRYYKGQLFYAMVTLSTAEAKAASKVWEEVVVRMQSAYGRPDRLQQAPRLASGKSIVDNLPLTEHKDQVLPLLWNERTHQDEASLYTLRDLQVRSGLWDPFAGWRFSNGVTIQTFIYQEPRGKGPPALRPLWIFVKDDLFRKWKSAVKESKLVEPRDY